MQLSREEIEVGMSSKFWQAIVERLQEYLVDIHLQMENSETDFPTYKELVGNALAIKRAAAIPSHFLLDLEDSKENKPQTDKELEEEE